MKVAFTHNLRLSDSEEEAEFDSAETVDDIAQAIEAAGHEVERIEVSGSASSLLERLEACDPDIIFNTAEGANGRMREAFYPSLFEELGMPYTGSAPYALTVTLDKWLTKLVLSQNGIDTPRSRLLTGEGLNAILETGIGMAYPVIVKPNYEGSSKGIAEDSVASSAKELGPLLRKALRTYPDGVLLEEFIPGIDVSVGYIDGVGHDGGLLLPVEYLVDSTAQNQYNLYDYRLKNIETALVKVRCPADVPRDVAARLRALSKSIISCLGLKDFARIDYRLGEDGRVYVLDVNGLPSLDRSSSVFAATTQIGLSYEQSIQAILHAGALRTGAATRRELGLRKRRKAGRPIRVGFTYNVKRESDGDEQAEWDPPETIISIANALARQGLIVVHLEATPDLPRVLAEADIDLIFNIAEGVEGRNREAQVPALCELLGIPYTGSDSATLAVALDKALAKKVLSQHDILTPEFQVFETGREKLQQSLKDRFPLIVKPNAEGSSKGIGSTNVVDNEEELREAVKNVLERYRQPALVEEYIKGREFTVGLLGEKRPRVLPPMEIRFRDDDNDRPVYDFTVKQEWQKHVYYECPAKLSASELKAIEKIARETFWALDCRDVGRVDLRMAEDGHIYVLEVNPLPGLTPDYSDLVLISKAVGMDYDSLIAEILVGGLRRMREKQREERDADVSSESTRAAVAAAKAEQAAKKAEKAEKAARKAAKLARRKNASRTSAATANGASNAATGSGNGNSRTGSAASASTSRSNGSSDEPTADSSNGTAHADADADAKQLH